MDYLVEQEMEIEALQAILMEEFEELDESPPEGWPRDAKCYKILLAPTGDRDDQRPSDADVCAELIFAHTPTYPDEQPHLKARRIRGLSPEDLRQLEEVIDEQVEANSGMAMIYAIVNAAQEWLREKLEAEGDLSNSLDPEEAKRKREEEAEARLAAVRAHGTPVTPETFTAWKQRLAAEVAMKGASVSDGTGAAEKRQRLSGKQYFLQLEANGGQVGGIEPADEEYEPSDGEADVDDDDDIDYSDDDDDGMLEELEKT